MFRIVSLALLLGLAGSVSHAKPKQECRNRVAQVIDGDTVKLRCFGQLVRLRLAGIDAPELKQPFGQHMDSMRFQHRVVLRPAGSDVVSREPSR